MLRYKWKKIQSGERQPQSLPTDMGVDALREEERDLFHAESDVEVTAATAVDGVKNTRQFVAGAMRAIQED